MEIPQGKKRDALTVILVENPQNTFTGNLRKAVSRLNPISNGEAKTKEKWKEWIVEETEKHDFLQNVSKSTADRLWKNYLEPNNCLKEVGKQKGAYKGKPLYKIDRSKIRKEILNGEDYERELPFWRHLINKGGDL